MGVNAYFPPKWTYRPQEAPNYRSVNSKFEVNYYVQTYFFLEELAHIRRIPEKEVQEVVYYSKGFNSNYMEFVGYETYDKLMWTSVKGYRKTNTISKQGFPNRNMNMTSPSGKSSLGSSAHKDTCDIMSESLVSQKLQAY